MISLIAAVSKGNVLADEHGIPWQGKMPADLKYFREMTEGKTVITGSKAFKEYDAPLPNRRNIVLTTDRTLKKEGFEFIYSIEEAVALDSEDSELMIIGGGKIYEQFLGYADKIYLTEIDAEYEGTVLFPDIPDEFKLEKSKCHEADSENAYDYCFLTYAKPQLDRD